MNNPLVGTAMYSAYPPSTFLPIILPFIPGEVLLIKNNDNIPPDVRFVSLIMFPFMLPILLKDSLLRRSYQWFMLRGFLVQKL